MKKEKFLAVILSLTLIFTMMPMSVFANGKAASPVNVQAVAVEKTGQVKITWNKVEGAKEYQVERYWVEPENVEWRKTTTATEVIDKSVLETGAPYGYVVTAVRKDGSKVSSEPAEYYGKLKAPKAKVSAVLSNGMNRVSWNSVESAIGYYVERKSSVDGIWEPAAITDELAIEDDNPDFRFAGEKVSYRVKALYDIGEDGMPCSPVDSIFSNVVSRTVDLARPVVTVSNVEKTGKIKVSWKAVKGAAKYEVSRATSKNGKYTVVKTTTAKSFVDEKKTTVGKKYFYKVKAIHKNANANSANSVVKSVYRDLAKPVITVAKSNGKPKVSWKKVDGAKHYLVYYKTGNGKFKSVKVTGKTWTHKKAVKGKTYTYKVKAIHKNSGANSAESTTKKMKATK